MNKWEYEVKEVDVSADMFKARLKSLGEEGCELVSINAVRAGHWAVTLKRPAKE